MKSLTTSLRILGAFAGKRSEWTVTALAEELGLGASQVSKNLTTFRKAGFLAQDPDTKCYSPGIVAFALGAQYLNNNALVHESAGVLRRIADLTQQTCVLSVLNGTQVLHLVSVEGPHFVDVGWRVGTWMPFHATAVGKVLYAFAPDALLEQAIEDGLPRYTSTTLCDPAQLREQLVQVRARGYAVTHQESMKGLGAQAVPLFGAGQEMIAAMGIVYPLHVVSEAARERYLDDLHAGARTVSLKLGCRVYPYGRGEHL